MEPVGRSLLERLIEEADTALRVLAAPARAERPSPGGTHGAVPSADADRRHAAALMRVNHSGEVAAQALYRGQALVARNTELREALLQAAREENDHLAWCADRTRELGGRTSLLTPLWYGGAFAMGVVAALAGDRVSLGFLAETEKQVGRHLSDNIGRLPVDDDASQAILTQMKQDEQAHGDRATERGGVDLPRPLRNLMWMTSRIMTGSSYRI